MSGGLKLNEVFDNQPSPDPVETRFYIGVSDLGRMGTKVGPGPASKFKLGPREPMPLDNGVLLYPVDEATHDEFMRTDGDDFDDLLDEDEDL